MKRYDVLLIGGGIAGLSAATLFARAGFSVAVFEKEQYPRHKVCGEYISRESLSFLEDVGLEALQNSLPQIDRLLVSTTRRQTLEAHLPLGGFGLSRYAFDAGLSDCAHRAGAEIFTGCKVEEVFAEGEWQIVKTSKGAFSAKLVMGGWGKKSNIDVKLKRPFLRSHDLVLDDWVGIKHHIRHDSFPENLIALHNFPGGYCGVSRIEENKVCLCYLVHKNQLQQAGNNIGVLEETVLGQNDFLKKIFSEAEFLFEKPLAISGISFQKRSTTEGDVLCLGDASGMIPPLSGNGMSIAMHTAKMAFTHGQLFLRKQKSRIDMARDFTRDWNAQFRKRMRMGRFLQGRLGNERLLRPLIPVLNTIPFLKKEIIRSTHGRPF